MKMLYASVFSVKLMPTIQGCAQDDLTIDGLLCKAMYRAIYERKKLVKIISENIICINL